MLFATTLLLAYYVYAAVGEKNLECSTSDERFFLSENELIIKCTITAKLKHFNISQMNLLFNNRSWAYSTNFHYEEHQDEHPFHIKRESLTSEHKDWLPKEPWKVYSEVLHSIGKITEFQGILLDYLTEPILQWSLGTSATLQLQDNSAILLTQSTCALDVVLIVPVINSGDLIYFGVTKKAFVDGNVQWFSRSNLCQGCHFLDLVLVNHYLLILMENKVFVSKFLLEKGNRNSVLPFTKVFDIPGCMSVKKGQLIYTPQCHYRFDDAFQDDTNIFASHKSYDQTILTDEPRTCKDDIIVLLYQCQTASGGTVTNVYMSSSANFSNWTAVGDSLKLHNSLSALAFNPQTNNLIMIYDSNSETIAEVHHVENLRVETSHVYEPFHFPAGNLLMGLFIHPISNFLYAYGEQVWLSSDDGLSFDAMPSPVQSDKIKGCKSGYSDGSIACVTNSNKILYSKGSPGRMWKVEPQNALSAPLTIYFDYMENLYAGYVENGQFKTVKVEVIDGIKGGSLNFTNPLMVEILSDKDIHLYEYRANPGNTQFSVFSMGMLLTSSKGGSVVIKDLELMSGSVASDGFMVKLRTLAVKKLTPDTSSALSATLSWAADDVWKTVVVPYTASFLVKEASGTIAKVKSMTNVRNMPPVTTGNWKMYDFRASSWSLREDKCRHSLESTLGVSNNYEVVDIDLRMKSKVEVSLGLSAPFEVGSDSFLFGYLTNPSIFRTNFYPSTSTAPLLEQLSVEIMPVINRKTVTTLRVFAVGASMLCPKTHILITIYGACPSQRLLTFIYPGDFARGNFVSHVKPLHKDSSNIQHSSREHSVPDLKPLQKDSPMIDLKPNYRPPSHLGYSIPTSDNIYNADPGVPRRHEDFKISKETGRLKQCATARTRDECGCTDRMRMTDEARFSDCKTRVFMITQPAVLETKFSMQVNEEIVAIPDNYLIRIVDVNNRSIRVQYKKGYSASDFSTALRNDKRFAKMAKEYFEPNSIEIAMEGSGLYHLRAEIMYGLSFCPLYSEFQVYVPATHLQYPVPFVINFAVAFALGGILFILALWYLTKHQYTPAIPATGTKCRDLNMKNTEPLHPPHSLLAVSLSKGDRNHLSSTGEQVSATELLESAKAQDLESVPHPKLSTGP